MRQFIEKPATSSPRATVLHVPKTAKTANARLIIVSPSA
jgi:hypothetical protein